MEYTAAAAGAIARPVRRANSALTRATSSLDCCIVSPGRPDTGADCGRTTLLPLDEPVEPVRVARTRSTA